jgi:hypothetical protein
VESFESIGDEILQDNKSLIPTTEITYIDWLTRSSPTRSASSGTEDANKVIDEDLIWQGVVFQSEL